MSGEDYRKVFSKKLQYYMDLNGKLQSDLCKDLGFTSSSVSSWCMGAKLPRPEAVDSIAKYFNVRRSDLLEYKKGDDEEEIIDSDGQKLLKAYNNNSRLKILFDKSLELSDDNAQVLIDLIERLKKTR